jgi:hypothetical protein
MRALNTTAPNPVITPTMRASRESGRRGIRRTFSSARLSGEAGGGLMDVSTEGAWSLANEFDGESAAILNFQLHRQACAAAGSP